MKRLTLARVAATSTRWVPTRWVSTLGVVALGASALGTDAPAFAAPPATFTATGQAVIHASGKVPETRTPVKVYYHQGQMRLEMTTPDYGDSIVLAKKGHAAITLMDTKQKLAFTVTPDAMPQDEGNLPMEQIMDLTSWKPLLQKKGKRLPGKEVKAGQACSLWQTVQGQTTTRIWFADALELPMQIESAVSGKPRFQFSVTSVSTKGKLSPSLFTVPSDFTRADLGQ